MKKRFSILTVVIVGFLMMAVGVGASAGYILWGGTDDYEQILVDLSLIKDNTIEERKSHKEELSSKDTEISDLEEEGKAKDNEIKDLKDKIASDNNFKNEVAKEIEKYINDVNDNYTGKGPKYDRIVELVNANKGHLGVSDEVFLNENPGNGQKSKELEQAVEDMQDVRNKTSGLLEELYGEDPDPDN